MSAEELLAVIPFYKNQRQLDACLSHLKAQTRAITPFVHDNSVENLGYTRAVNLGFRQAIRAGHKYVITLNQDIYLDPGAVAGVVAFLEATPKCAIAGIKQRASNNPDFIIHAGCTTAYPNGMHVSGLASMGVGAVSGRMPWVNGAILAARVDAMLDFGLMDENMFLFGSDADWCYSARARNWETWYCAEAECVHEVGASSNPTAESGMHFRHDMDYFRDKWIGTPLYKRLDEAFNVGMSVPAAKKAVVGPYDACPCGSGKKFKFCCMKKAGG